MAALHWKKTTARLCEVMYAWLLFIHELTCRLVPNVLCPNFVSLRLVRAPGNSLVEKAPGVFRTETYVVRSLLYFLTVCPDLSRRQFLKISRAGPRQLARVHPSSENLDLRNDKSFADGHIPSTAIWWHAGHV